MNTLYYLYQEESNLSISKEYSSKQIERINGYSVQFVFTPLPNTDAKLMIEASNDNINFDEIECSNLVVSSNSSLPGSKLFNCSNVYYSYFRPKIVITTGGFSAMKINVFTKGN